MKLTKTHTLLAVVAIAALQSMGQTVVAAPPAPVEQAYELSAGDLTLPTNEFGSVILKPCPTCDSVTLRVDGNTSYVYNGARLPLREFRSAVLNLREPSGAATTVIYRLEDNKVRRIEVTKPDLRSSTDTYARG